MLRVPIEANRFKLRDRAPYDGQNTNGRSSLATAIGKSTQIEKVAVSAAVAKKPAEPPPPAVVVKPAPVPAAVVTLSKPAVQLAKSGDPAPTAAPKAAPAPTPTVFASRPQGSIPPPAAAKAPAPASAPIKNKASTPPPAAVPAKAKDAAPPAPAAKPPAAPTKVAPPQPSAIGGKPAAAAPTSKATDASAAAPANTTTFVAKGGQVAVDVMSSDSGYDNKIYWSSDNWKTKNFIGVDNNAKTVNLGSFAAGTKIEFGIDNGQGDFFKTGAASGNADNFQHAKVDASSAGTQIGFEDLRGGGDRDFNDAIINVRNVPAPTAAPGGGIFSKDVPTVGSHDNRSGLGDGTNPGKGAGTANSPNTGTNNPNQASKTSKTS